MGGWWGAGGSSSRQRGNRAVAVAVWPAWRAPSCVYRKLDASADAEHVVLSEGRHACCRAGLFGQHNPCVSCHLHLNMCRKTSVPDRSKYDHLPLSNLPSRVAAPGSR